MDSSFYERVPSRFSYIDHYWRMRDETTGEYPLYMTVRWGFVFSHYDNTVRVQLIGPRTKPDIAYYRVGELFWGVTINADVNLATYTKRDIVNRIIELPCDNQTFQVAGVRLDIPGYEALDAFTGMLIEKDILQAAPVAAVSHRDTQRKVKRFTGLTPKQIEQADRVEAAMTDMMSEPSLSVVAARAGFADQAHMTRDFKRLVGYTPAEMQRMFRET